MEILRENEQNDHEILNQKWVFEVGRGVISSTISMSSDASSRTMILFDPDLSGIHLCAFYWSISKEIDGLLKLSDEASIPIALSLY